MKLAGIKIKSANVNLSEGGIMDDKLLGKRIKLKALDRIKKGDYAFIFSVDDNLIKWYLITEKIKNKEKEIKDKKRNKIKEKEINDLKLNDDEINWVNEYFDSVMLGNEFATLEHSVVGLRVLNVLETKGGDISVNEFSDDTLYTETSTSYVLKKEFNISTPTPPSGLTVYKWALMVSVQIYHTSQVSKVKIDIDDVELAELTTTTTKTWYDRSKEVSSGSHTVKIYMKTTVAGGTCKTEGIKAVCGIGTNSTSDVKVAEVETCGEGLGTLAVVGKSYGENATITGSQKVDDNEFQKSSASGSVTKGGTSYNYSSILSGAMYDARNTYYGKTSSGNVPIFHNYSRTIVRRTAH